MEVMEAIMSRRSVREFTDEDVEDDIIGRIIEAGRWAPSGLNNQAWRFIIVRDAPVLIVVFLDRDAMYDHIKDVQSIGACVQNMLLAIHSLGLAGYGWGRY